MRSPESLPRLQEAVPLAMAETVALPSMLSLMIRLRRCWDAAGNLYFSDDNNAIIRRIDADTGIITTVAGTTGSFGYSGDDGSATAAQLDDSEGLAFDSAGNLYITDSSNNLIREVSASTGIITTIAGDGTTSDGYTGDGGSATSALLAYPVTPVIDSMGNLFFDDNSNNVVREVGGAAPMNFGSVFVNATSSVQDLVVTNEGNAPLTLTSIAFTADFAGKGFDPAMPAQRHSHPWR